MGPRVLIVDDHAAFRARARRMLTSFGYEVVAEAKDADSAVRAASSSRPDVVLLDVQLPGRSGLELVSELQNSSPGVRVLLISSRDAEDYGPLIASSGADGFISKVDLSGQLVARLLAK